MFLLNHFSAKPVLKGRGGGGGVMKYIALPQSQEIVILGMLAL